MQVKRREKIFILVAVLLTGYIFSLAAFAEPTHIEVFVDQPLIAPSIPNALITVFDLSRADAIKKMHPRFPPNEVQATASAKAWLDSPAGKSHIENLKVAYASREKMVNYGLQKIPAIVFERGKFVIYGTTDIKQAVDDYDHYLRKHNQ